MKFKGVLCIVCSLICAVFIGSSDATVTGWTTPSIESKTGSASLTVAESAAAGDTVETLVCNVDKGSPVYAIGSQPADNKLEFSTANLSIATGKSFDYDTDPTYTLEVTCTDNGDNDVGTATITVSVSDQPVFTTMQFVGTIPDGSTAGTSATVNVSVTDQNTGDTQTYFITAGDDNSEWVFDGNKLKVASGKTLDATTLAEYTLTIKSNDGLQDSSNTATVWISLYTCSKATAVAGGLAVIFTVALSMLL